MYVLGGGGGVYGQGQYYVNMAYGVWEENYVDGGKGK